MACWPVGLAELMIFRSCRKVKLKTQDRRGQEADSAVKSTGSPSRESEFSPQHPHRGSQPSVAPVPVDSVPSSGL